MADATTEFVATGDPFRLVERVRPHLPPLAADVCIDRTVYVPERHGGTRVLRVEVSYVLGLLTRRRIRRQTVSLDAAP